MWSVTLGGLVALLSIQLVSRVGDRFREAAGLSLRHHTCCAKWNCSARVASRAGKLPPLAQNCSSFLISNLRVFFLRGCTAFRKCDDLKESGVTQVEILIPALLGIQQLEQKTMDNFNFHVSLSKEVIVLAEKKYMKNIYRI